MDVLTIKYVHIANSPIGGKKRSLVTKVPDLWIPFSPV